MGQFIKAAKKSEIPEGSAKAVEINGKMIAIFHVQGQFYAIDDTCTHAAGPLSEGSVTGNVVMCPWHGAEFDITCGKALGGPAGEDVGAYKVNIQGEDIEVEV